MNYKKNCDNEIITTKFNVSKKIGNGTSNILR